jgi:hypothetical protein
MQFHAQLLDKMEHFNGFSKSITITQFYFSPCFKNGTLFA